MTAEQIREARGELKRFGKQFAKIRAVTAKAGQSAAQAFRKNFKSVATFAIKEFATGALQALGTRWGENVGKAGAKAGKNLARRFKRSAKQGMGDATSGSGGIFSVLKGGAAALGIGVAAKWLAGIFVSQLKGAIGSAMDQEQLEISLDSLSVDNAGGSRIFESLRADALRTGVAVEKLSGNVRKMMAQGIAEADALKLSDAMLDIGGATGLTTSEIELLGNALSQVKGKGVAAMEELRGQIAEKGVPIFEALRQRFDAGDVSEVFDMISKGQVTADDVLDTFKNLEGPFAKFAGAADRMGSTGLGLFGRLRQQVVDLKREFAEEILPTLKPVLEEAIGFVERMKRGAKKFGEFIADAVGWIRAVTTELSIGEMLQLAGLKFKEALLEALDAAARGAYAVFEAFNNDKLGEALERSAHRFKQEMLKGMEQVLKGLSGMKFIGDEFLFASAAMTEQRLSNDIRFKEKFQNNPGPDVWELIQKEFAAQPQMFGLSQEDSARIKDLITRIILKKAEQDADLGNTPKPKTPNLAPAGDTGKKKSFSDPTAALGSGLAGAINKVAGGAGTVILDKQLAVQQKTRAAVEKAAKGIDKLVKQTNPRRNRSTLSQAKLVL